MSVPHLLPLLSPLCSLRIARLFSLCMLISRISAYAHLLSLRMLSLISAYAHLDLLSRISASLCSYLRKCISAYAYLVSLLVSERIC